MMKKTCLWALAGVPLVMVLGNSMLIPVLPAMKKAFGISAFQTGLVITLFSVPAGFSILFTGFLADRFGRRTVLLPALGLYALGGLAAGLSWLLLKEQGFPYLLLSRVFQGIGAAGTAPVAMALVGDLFGGGGRSRALGVLEASNGTGKILSPVLGAAVGIAGWFYPFFVFPLLVLPVLLAVLFLVSEPAAQRQPPSLRGYLLVLAALVNRKGLSLTGAFFAGMTVLLILFGLLFFLSEHIETSLGVDGVPKGFLLAVPVAFMSAASYVTGRVIKKRLNLMPAVVTAGLLLLAGALASFIFVCGTVLFFAGTSLAGIGAGVALPCLNTLVTSCIGPDARGIVTAFYGGVRFLGVAIGPPFFALLLSLSVQTTFTVAAALAGLTALLTLLFIRGGVITSPVEVKSRKQKS
ncbi:MAG: MFS transporter [Bacillota bacterium]|jgi:ACDE family multidrug resistance protein|nr:MFS transporter [Thermoanaerobacteraceae bacterium]